MSLSTARVYVEAPAVTPATGGLLAVATIPTTADPHVMLGVEYQPESCGPASVDIDRCAVDADLTSKTFQNGVTLLQASPFTVYKGVECDLWSHAETLQRAITGLTLGQGRAIEEQFWTTLLSGGTATTLAATAQSPRAALGLLEQYAGDNYGGVPTFHIGRAVIPFFPDLVVVAPDGSLRTVQGSKIANGAGYSVNLDPDGDPAAAGEAWMYVTGEVVVHLGPVVQAQAPILVNNRSLALAERAVVVTAECMLGAVRVTLAGA